MSQLKFGEISAMAGNASFEAVKKVIDLALAGEVDATVTGPINKKSVNEAGHHFAGHTEIYAHYTNTKKYAMLLVEDHMKVIHVSTHVSLSAGLRPGKKDRIVEVTELLHNGLYRLGETNLKIGIAGLNPHAGDSGLFGTEDDQEILPAVQEARPKVMMWKGLYLPIPCSQKHQPVIMAVLWPCITTRGISPLS
jgi:4-hydroxy-L-threonine phosphate dehydrogenase PdxA